MISPGERFDAFSSNRLIKKEDNTSMLGSNTKFVLSPNKHSLFVFIHQLNRSITNSPWVFWVPAFVTFIQFEIAVIAPLNSNHWKSKSEMKDLNYVLSIILRYVPIDAPQFVTDIIFAIYSVFLVVHVILLISIISLIKHKKDINIPTKIFFFYSYLFFPLLRSSILCIVSEEVTRIVREPHFGTFFLSLLALIILLLNLFMTSFLQFSMGSSPSPNLNNPLAIWGPCAWRSVVFELYISLIFIFIEFTRSVNNETTFAILIILVVIVSIPHAVVQSWRTYFISYNAYEYINSLLWGMIVFDIFHIVQCFLPDSIPFWVFIFIWILLPILFFIIMKIVTQLRLKKVFKGLSVCDASAETANPNQKNDQDEMTNMNMTLNDQIYDVLNVRTTSQAIFVARAACLFSHRSFTDLSILRYFIERFPDGLFCFIHLVFLGHNPNQAQFQFVEKLVNIYLESRRKGIGILQLCVFFQIITSIQESSNDIPPSLVRDFSKQKIQAMKCQQLLSKFWTSGCKGDITQMSKNAFALNKHIASLNESWKLLVMRYPYSLPVVNAYVEYLLTTGTQHHLAELILSSRPQASDSSSSTTEPDKSVSILHQAIEDAVDRRPIISINRLTISLTISILLALVFFLIPIIISFITVNKYSRHNDFVHYSVGFESIFASVPNYFDDLAFIENGTFSKIDQSQDFNYEINVTLPEEFKYRQLLIRKTENLANYLNQLLRKMPSDILKDSSNLVHSLYLNFDLYESNRMSSYINSLRITSYFAQALPFVSIDDPCSILFIKNFATTLQMIEETTVKSIYSVQNTVDLFVKFSPVFYVVNWGLLIIVIVPLIYFSIKALKEEITYLLSIYLTIPRSILTKLAERRTGGSVTGGIQQDQMNGTLLMPTQFNLQATGSDNNGVPIVNNDNTKTNGNNNNNNDDNKNNNATADAFKMLVTDHSNANYSVLPKFFVFKITFAFGFLVVFITILSTVTSAILISFSKSLVSCLYTQRLTSERTVGSSVIMHGLTSYGKDIKPEQIVYIINMTGKFHTAILFKDSNYNLSSSALNNEEIADIQSKERCNDKSDDSCLSLVLLFDIFTTQAISISNSFLSEEEFEKINQSLDNYNSLRKTFNNELFPLLYETQELVYKFTHDEIRKFRINLIIVIIVGVIISILILIFFMAPIIREINMTVESVKLPFKHISPLDIADFQKILMYLQGECDFKRNGVNEISESSNSNVILNAMLSPFAIFEADLSLLFANNSFYSLLETSREASIGLPLSEIFSLVFPFRNDENHPFNSLLNSITKMMQGERIDDVQEIKTELEFPEIKTCPVLIRMSPIYKDEESKESNSKFHFDNTIKSNSKPAYYAMFITDLSYKKELEEKIKYEEEEAQKLINSTIPKTLSSLIRKGNKLAPKRFENIAMAMFSINLTSAMEEFEDEMMTACNIFLKTANDINHNFTRTVVKLVHHPPRWFYISCLSLNVSAAAIESNRSLYRNFQSTKSTARIDSDNNTARTDQENSAKNDQDSDQSNNDKSAEQLNTARNEDGEKHAVINNDVEYNDQSNTGRNEEISLDDLINQLTNLFHFVISVIDVFNASSSKDFSLKAVVHVGQLFIVPVMLDLPMIEALGSGFQKLKNMKIPSKNSQLLCTSEVEKILRNNNMFKFTPSLEGNDDSLFNVKIENEE